MSIYPYIDKNPKRVVDVLKMQHRLGPYPIDPSSVFNTLSDLQQYVNNPNSSAYAGQLVAVANGDITVSSSTNFTIYVIRSDRTLQQIACEGEIEELATASNYRYAENKFETEVLATAMADAFKFTLIERFENCNFVDKTLYDGQYIVDNYFDSPCHSLKKNDLTEKKFSTNQFNYTIDTKKVRAVVDYDGTGSVEIYITKDNGVTQTKLTNNVVTDYVATAGTNIRLIVVLNGQVRLCNFALEVM